MLEGGDHVLTDDIIQIASLGDSIGGVLVQRAKVLTKLSVRSDVKGELLSEDCLVSRWYIQGRKVAYVQTTPLWATSRALRPSACSYKKMTYCKHLQIILLFLAQILKLRFPFNHSSHGNSDVLNSSTSSFDKRSESGTVGIGSMTSVGDVEHLEGRVRFGSNRVVCCIISELLVRVRKVSRELT